MSSVRTSSYSVNSMRQHAQQMKCSVSEFMRTSSFGKSEKSARCVRKTLTVPKFRLICIFFPLLTQHVSCCPGCLPQICSSSKQFPLSYFYIVFVRVRTAHLFKQVEYFKMRCCNQQLSSQRTMDTNGVVQSIVINHTLKSRRAIILLVRGGTGCCVRKNVHVSEVHFVLRASHFPTSSTSHTSGMHMA